jgi:hypothetical protein
LVTFRSSLDNSKASASWPYRRALMWREHRCGWVQLGTGKFYVMGMASSKMVTSFITGHPKTRLTPLSLQTVLQSTSSPSSPLRHTSLTISQARVIFSIPCLLSVPENAIVAMLRSSSLIASTELMNIGHNSAGIGPAHSTTRTQAARERDPCFCTFG